VSSIRQRLRCWRKENDISTASDGGIEPPIPLRAASTHFQIPAPNSVGPEENMNDLAGEDMVDHVPDPLDGYTDQYAAATSILDAGDLVEIRV
jgi:hypothetical protein